MHACISVYIYCHLSKPLIQFLIQIFQALCFMMLPLTVLTEYEIAVFDHKKNSEFVRVRALNLLWLYYKSALFKSDFPVTCSADSTNWTIYTIQKK